MRHEDDKDARAFTPLAGGIERLLKLDDQGLLPKPVFHYRTRKGIACGTAEAVYTRDSSYAVTCEACRIVCKADEAKAEARKAKRRAKR